MRHGEAAVVLGGRMWCTELDWTGLDWTLGGLYYAILYCTILYYTILHCNYYIRQMIFHLDMLKLAGRYLAHLSRQAGRRTRCFPSVHCVLNFLFLLIDTRLGICVLCAVLCCAVLYVYVCIHIHIRT